VDDLVQKMGAKDPHERFQTAGEVVAALSPWLPVAQWVALGINPHALTTPPPERVEEAEEEKAAAVGREIPTRWIVAGVLGTAVLAALVAAAVGR
jgi:hypothetical protein